MATLVSIASQVLSLEQTTSQLSDFILHQVFCLMTYVKQFLVNLKEIFQTLYMCVFHKSLCGMLGSERRFHVMCL